MAYGCVATSYLGVVIDYYGHHLSKLAEAAHPLNKLLRKRSNRGNRLKSEWSTEERKAWLKLKSGDLDTSSKSFDAKLPLILACDASSFGLGAVLAHYFADGAGRPSAYANQSFESRAELHNSWRTSLGS